MVSRLSNLVDLTFLALVKSSDPAFYTPHLYSLLLLSSDQCQLQLAHKILSSVFPRFSQTPTPDDYFISISACGRTATIHCTFSLPDSDPESGKLRSLHGPVTARINWMATSQYSVAWRTIAFRRWFFTIKNYPTFCYAANIVTGADTLHSSSFSLKFQGI